MSIRSIPLLATALMSALAPEISAQAASPPLPSCGHLFDELRARVETNYAGFHLEVRGERQAAYQAEAARLRAAAVLARDEGCLGVLQAFAAWFSDPHLFIFQGGRLDSAEASRRTAGQERTGLTEAAIRRRLGAPGSRDPIEGVWYDRGLRLGVLAEPDSGPGRFVALVLTPDTAGWDVGAVRARFTRTGPATYAARLAAPNHAVRHLQATLHAGGLLRLSPGMWGREGGSLHPHDPRRPVLTVGHEAVVVTLPSHDPTYRPVLDSLLRAHAEALRDADLLVVDLRGNEGGGSRTSDALLPYLVVTGQAASPLLDARRAVMLSSPAQVAYARRAFGPDTSAFVRGLVQRLEAAPGELVPLLGPDLPWAPPVHEPAPGGPRRAAILVDRGTVSAAEVLVLVARESDRVTVYGEPTAGALDYQSVNIVPLVEGERRWYLGYPTITRHAELPAGGMRGRGIAPDVALDLEAVADPIGWVVRDLRMR